MKGEIYQYYKFGFCKYRKECKKGHYSEECEDQDTCKSISTCNKRHPGNCRKNVSGQCKFKSDCAYKYLEPKENQE